MINETIEKYLVKEARGDDFYGDRDKLAERLKGIAQDIQNMNLPDPDSDFYLDYRKGTKDVLDALKRQVDSLEFYVKKALSKHKL